MALGRIIAAGGAVLLVLVYAAGSGIWVASGRSFYLALDRPPWQPPDAVFGLIWPYNFIVLAIGGVIVATAAARVEVLWWLGLTAVSVVAALAWARLFYVNEALWPAALALAVAAVITIPVVVITWRTTWWAGLLLVPYVLWLFTATSLAIGYAIRNP